MKTIPQQPAAKQEPDKPENETPPKIEVKTIKHTFDQDERNQIGGDLARGIANLRGIDTEFDQVKASYKAKLTEAEAKMDKLSTDLMNGFEMRDRRCVVVYRPRDRKKDYIAEEDWDDFGAEALPALTEDMSQSDFQAELLQAESRFDHRAAIALFPSAGSDFGTLIVGELKGNWFAALRAQIGGHKLEERLDSEQSCAKKRYDIVRRTAVRFFDWLNERLGKEAAKGFKDAIEKAVEAQKEKVE